LYAFLKLVLQSERHAGIVKNVALPVYGNNEKSLIKLLTSIRRRVMIESVALLVYETTTKEIKKVVDIEPVK
jgi:hypothetical protein